MPSQSIFTDHITVPYTFFRVSRQLLTAKHSQPLLVRIRNAVIIWIMGKLSWRQIHAAMPGTLATYLAWMKRRGLKAHVTQLEGSSDGVQGKGFEDARILWVGEEWSEDKDGKVLLYFHGKFWELGFMTLECCCACCKC